MHYFYSSHKIFDSILFSNLSDQLTTFKRCDLHVIIHNKHSVQVCQIMIMNKFIFLKKYNVRDQLDDCIHIMFHPHQYS